ncbi:MAG: outer membrane protein assembly factor BamA, partial [Deltaproteobacteria bacterium]|nr:outer membrane protein assembly factor BamA [Deltaproteobacteria bacterium]
PEKNKPSVAVLPFKIFAERDSVDLGKDVVKIISNLLKTQGASMANSQALMDSIPPEGFESTKQVRQLGEQAEVDYIIQGSISLIGEGYSIDIKLVSMKGDESSENLYSTGSRIENLHADIKKMAFDIAGRIMQTDTVENIIIEGNERIEDDAVKRKIKTKPGDAFIKKNISMDLKRVYDMGYFDDIRVEAKQGIDGKIIIFTIKERPTIKDIIFSYNSDYDDEEIEENIDIRKGSILNTVKIKREINKIETFYRDKNYHNAKVTYSIEKLDNNQANLELIIDEGDEALVEKIVFEGNNTFSDDELKDLQKDKEGLAGWSPLTFFESGELGEMETTEKGLFSFLTDSGKLDEEGLSQDAAKLRAFYGNNGFSLVKIGEPQISYEEDAIFIKIKIEEGPRFKVGTINIEGDLIIPEDDLMVIIAFRNEEYLNQGLLRKDIIVLHDIYADRGYFYTDILPLIDRDIENKISNVTLKIKKNNLVYFEKIIIAGNTSTRDKVIRRELPVVEQDLYSGSRLQRGIRNLQRLDYFEDVKVNTVEGSYDDKMILKIDVEEKPTGAFSFGGGYSTVENIFASVSITERNLFGRGQILRFSTEVGGQTTQFNASFTEPWLFDIPLSASLSLYNISKDYDTYRKDTTGCSVGLGYPVFDYTRLSATYIYELNDYRDIEPLASDFVKDLEGESNTSKLITRLHYDSRDRAFNASEGSDHSLTSIYAGGPLGGDIGFSKYLLKVGRYFPLFWSTVGFLHAETGFVRQNSGGKLPDEERFHLGGMNSIRGFGWHDISPVRYNEIGDVQIPVTVGGNKYIQFNVEYIFPIVNDLGLNGLVFYDMGNAFDNGDPIDFTRLRKGAGYGIRWYSPVGPIRIEVGHILDPKEGENGSGKVEFTMGSAF